MKKYSQNNEQDYILNYFSEQNTGKFIDIGAYDGITFSNVRALAEKGWSGVCYEADAKIFNTLKENYSTFENVLCVHCAVHTFNGNIVFYGSNGDAVGTTSVKHIEKWQSSVTFENATLVRCFDVNELLEQDKDADFINIDVEGVNYELFNYITDLNFSRFKMICIEHDGHNAAIYKRLKNLGFTEIYLNGENGIYAKL